MMIVTGLLGLLLFGGILIALFTGGAAWLRRQASADPSGESRDATARDLLDRRLARGELSREEYAAIREQIES